jgi:maleylacetoacetate isomerase
VADFFQLASKKPKHEHLTMALTLYSYFRSSTAYRVRIALNLKGLVYNQVGINLLAKANRDTSYLSVNPQGRVPALLTEDRVLLTQSLTIMEWLDETYPTLPQGAYARAKVRAAAHVMATDIHALQNSSTTAWLREKLSATPEQIQEWYDHWMGSGLESVENLIEPGPFCFGSAPTLADVCLIPQLASARRVGVAFAHLPKIVAVASACEKLEAFAKAAPAAQPDAF